MGDLIRCGVIGTGMLGFEHLRNLAPVPGAKLTAIADPHEPSRRWGREPAGADRRVYASPPELSVCDGLLAVALALAAGIAMMALGAVMLLRPAWLAF